MIVQKTFSKGLPINHGSRCEWPSVTPGEHFSVRVSSEETDGTYTMLEIVADHRNGTPMHLHQNEDEHFIILEGMAHLPYGEKTVNAPAGTNIKEAEIKQGHRQALYWLISLVALVFLLVGILCLLESATPRRASADQLRFAAEGEPSEAEIALGQAIQPISVRH
jgi:hypothetical protein